MRTFVECSAEDTASVLEQAINSDKMTIIVSKCESGNVKVPVIELDPVVIKHRFMAELASRNSKNQS